MIVEFSGELLPKEYKGLEKQIIQFFVETGQRVVLNSKASEIFGYFKIFDNLTQEQLKKLTNFSTSTISTTLQLFLNLGTVSKEIQSNSRKKLYRLRNYDLIYTPFKQIIDFLESIDLNVIALQNESKEYKTKHPNQTEFFIRRLNHIRNYVEVQRRAINSEKKYSFFNENTSELLQSQIFIDYPPEILKIEEKFVTEVTNRNLFASNDPIHGRILSFFITRQRLDQDTLIQLTGFSRSTISRYLKVIVDTGFVNLKPKEYQKSQIYYIESATLSYISEILKTDYFIFSWVSKFKDILTDLKTNTKFTKNNTINDFMIGRVSMILNQIEVLRASSNLLEHARDEFLRFLKKK
ncbi:MAG: MarR family transcriptional regulator [Asgard group archaeon]|nr:MarR family transcriptional regulator [Asgard group archaeon]